MEVKRRVGVVGGGRPGVMAVMAVIVGHRPTVKVKVWTCKNCGHEELQQASGNIPELNFRYYSNLTSRITCPACGAYTIQQAYTDEFLAGHFLVVKPKNVIKGKG